jgi:pimeloyl-ACP methyl ester carboxylesterase
MSTVLSRDGTRIGWVTIGRGEPIVLVHGRGGRSLAVGPDRLQALLDAGDTDGAVELTFREIVGLSDEQVGSMRGRPEWAGRRAAVKTLPRELRTEPSITLSEDDLRSIGVPVLFLIGGQNKERLLPQANQPCSCLRSGRIGVLPGQGHMAMDTAPEMLADAIISFVESTI